MILSRWLAMDDLGFAHELDHQTDWPQQCIAVKYDEVESGSNNTIIEKGQVLKLLQSSLDIEPSLGPMEIWVFEIVDEVFEIKYPSLPFPIWIYGS